MQKYEVIVIAEGSLADDQLEKAETSVKSTLEKNGKILGEETWGKRRLAYKIGRSEEGYYYFYNIEAEPEKLSKIKDFLRHNTDLLRFLILKQEK